MTDRYPAIISGFPHMLHGGDYNPDQWRHVPGIVDEDFRLMELAGVNSASIGIFAWAALEPSEGEFDFGWMDRIMDRLADAGYIAVLATPSGSRPKWLGEKYTEVRRIDRQGRREHCAARHNHCPTSPIYREKVSTINEQLAERYAAHPALGLWHLSNEYSGECFCDLCLNAFRGWLQRRYGTLEALNEAWWAGFWSHTYTDWSQVHPFDFTLDAIGLDWRRFASDQMIDFMRYETAALRRHSTNTPVTTNLMGTFPGLDYFHLAEHIDVVSWDWYPNYADRDMWSKASRHGFTHDLMRGLKQGKPFLLMESSPSNTNWFNPQKIKRPCQHRLESLQAIAHGADSVQYFQFRKGRGGAEKYHGAIVDHVGHEHTRVFEDVVEVGSILKKLDGVVGAAIDAEVAILHDWQARWALEGSIGPGDQQKDYVGTAAAHHRPFWRNGVATDVIHPDMRFDRYKVVIAPMLYMLKPGWTDRLRRFVEAGGTLITTYLTGYVNESNLCFTGGWPGNGLRQLLGIWNEEIDTMFDDDPQSVQFVGANPMGLRGEYGARVYCERIHAEGADILATYGRQFYAGGPAITLNRVGNGRAIYIATRTDDELLNDLYGWLIGDLGLKRAIDSELPKGVSAHERRAGDERYVFLFNYTHEAKVVDLGGETFTDLIDDRRVAGTVELGNLGSVVLKRA